MRRLLPIFALLLSLSSVSIPARAQSACGLDQPAFCDTFDQPAGNGNRSGQLDGTVWGASRTTGNVNMGGGLYNPWPPVATETCSGTATLRPENDIVVCNGQVREATDDAGSVTVLAMYPKQPFDFAGRTGTVAFDVSNDTQGNHAAWPEFWMTDQPVPAPFTHEASWLAVPRNGFGVRFAASTEPGHGAGLAPGCPNDNSPRFTVDSAIVVRNYVPDDSFNGGAISVTPVGCVIASTGPNDGLNHVELHVSQAAIDVYATDAGKTGPLVHIAQIPNANLTLTRGLIWIEDVHYFANKFNSQGVHTFAWDNVGFDGPVLPRDLTFDAPDALSGTNLGWREAAGEAKAISITGVTGLDKAQAALLTFDFFPYDVPSTLTYVVNGHSHTVAWPYPDKQGFGWRTLAVPVPLDEVQAGANIVSVTATQPLVVSNMDIVLAGAGDGAVPVTPVPTATVVPTSVPTAAATLTPSPSATPVATPSPVPTAGTCSAVLIQDGQVTSYPRPLSECSAQ